MKKKTNQKIRSKKKRKPGNKKFSQALIGGAFIALGCGCFAYPNFREWNTQREVEQIIDNFDKTYSQGLDYSIPDKAANAESEEQNESQNNKKTDGNTTATETPQPEQSESSAGDSAAEQTVGDTDEKNAADESADNGSDNTISTRPYQYLYDEMDKYNKNLAQNGQSISDAWSYEQQPMDLDSLNIDSDNPIIGYIEIPDMKIRLPLMLGASSKNLEKGAAVLSQTSMPIGGENTNCVIAGHRGWEGSAYFQYIENMKVGSKVYITNPWETLVYECTSIKVIYPDDVNSILIQPGKDMVTLFSCHPYVLGGGPYRYLVFCERVDTQKRQEVDGILNPKSEEEPAENTDDITITDIPEETTGSSESDTEAPEISKPAQTTATVSPAAAETVPSAEDIDSYRTFMGIDLLALEQTLRYMLPVVVIVISILIIMFRCFPKGKKPKKKIKKPIKKNNNAKRRKKTMKYNAIAKKLSMTTLAAAMLAAPAVNVFAATDVTIDANRVGSLTIHKYDITAATAKGFNTDKYKPDGKQNAEAEAELANYKIEGVEFTYMKVGDISTDTVGGQVKVMYGIPAELEKILGIADTRGDHKHTSDEVYDAMKNILLNNTQSKNKLEDYVMTGYGHTAMPMTDENGISTATSLPIGLYLIIETKVPANVNTTVDPFFVSLPMTDKEGAHWFYDVHAYPKNQTNIPDIDKRVRQRDDVGYGKPEYLDTATSSEGEIVDYIVTSHMPKITSKATFLTKYTFVDTIAKGLTYNRDLSIYFYDNEADAKANNTDAAVAHWDVDSEYFRSSYNAASEKASQCTVQMTEMGLKEINKYNSDTQIETNYSGRWMVLSYSATVNADTSPILGDFGNNNDVNLTWRRTNMDKDDRLEDKCRVFSYGLDIKKEFLTEEDNDNKGNPTDVKFSLKNATDGHYIVARQDKAGSGIYYVVDASKKVVGGADGLDEEAARDGATAFTPSDDGTLIINGLEANDYILTETHTSRNYNLLKDPIKISIHQTQDEFVPSKTTLYDIVEITNNPNKTCLETNGERAHAEVDGSKTEMTPDTFTVDNKPASGNASVSTNARVKMKIVNTPSGIPQLPATGGAGTIAFTVAGCTVAFAGVMVATRKNKKDDENK